MLRPLSTQIFSPSPMFAGVSAFAAGPAHAAAAGFIAGSFALQPHTVSGRDSTSAFARRFAASSEIYLAMSAESSGGAGSAGGAGAPPASGGGDGNGFDRKTNAYVKRLITRLIKKYDFGNGREAALRRPETENTASILVKALSVGDEYIRYASAWALGRIGPLTPEVVPALIEALKKDESAYVRGYAAGALGSIGPVTPEVVPTLIARMNDESAFVRVNTAGALARIGPATPDAVRVLIESLKYGEGGGGEEQLLCQQAVEWFNAISIVTPEVLCLLIEALKDKSSFVRDRAGETLGQIGLAAVPSLMALMRDDDASVHERAADIILKILKQCLDGPTEALEDRGNEASEASTRVQGKSGAAIQALIELLKEEKGDLGIYSAEVLAKIGPAAVPALLAIVEDPSGNAREKAVYALGRIGPVTPDVVPALIARLGDEQSDVREAAARALGNIGHVTPQVVPALIELLADPAWGVRMRAAYGLGDIGPAAGDAASGLTALLSDGNSHVCHAAVRALGEIGRPVLPHAVPALIELYNIPSYDVRFDTNFHFAVKNLLVDNIGADGFPVLIETLKAESHEGPRKDWEFLSEIDGFAAALMTAIERMTQAERSRVLRLLPESVQSQIFGNELADIQERIEKTADILAQGFAMVLGLGKASGSSGSTATYGTVSMVAPRQGHSLVLAQSLELQIKPQNNDLIKVDGGSHPDEARAMLRSLGFIVPHEVGHIVQGRRGIEGPKIDARFFGLFDGDEVRDQANEVLVDGLALSIARRGHLDILPSGEEAEDAREAEAVRSYVELAKLALSRHAEGVSPLGPSMFARMIAVMHEMVTKEYEQGGIVEGVKECAERYWKAAVEGRDEPWVARFVQLTRAYRKIFRAARRVEV